MHIRYDWQTAPLVLVAIMMSACQPQVVRSTNALRPFAVAMVASDTTDAFRYRVDTAASAVHILVYRAGALARLGHNHVVSSKDVTGAVYLNKELARSSVEIRLPVATLVVDDATARSQEGEAFAADVPSDAREGTRRNLLSAAVLDLEHYPTITLQSVAIAGTRSNPNLTMRITIKDVARDVPLAVVVRKQGERIEASGEFEIKQSDFGITPFSVALGALQVQDRLRIRFSIVCTQQQ